MKTISKLVLAAVAALTLVACASQDNTPRSGVSATPMMKPPMESQMD
jgi:hypothetical protein